MKKLDAAVEQRQVKSLIVVAPPRALGIIRPCTVRPYEPPCASNWGTRGNFVKLPVHEIEKHLTAA